MRQLLLLLLVFPLLTFGQFNFTHQSQAYTYLSGSNLYYSAPWNESTFFPTPISIGFTFNYFGNSVNTIIPDGMGGITLGDGSQFDGYLSAFGASLRSKGAQSPITYKTEGNTGSRIFKLEIKNAGFFYEYDSTNTVNYQLWLYEGTNKIEYHYGFNKANGGAVIYQLNTGAFVGLFYSDGTNDYQIRLRYNPANPSLETDLQNEYYLAGCPKDSTVYTFIPNSTGINNTGSFTAISVYPNPVSNTLLFSSEAVLQTIELYTLTGEQVFALTTESKTGSVNISHLPMGLYVARLKGEGFEVTHKVIKQ